jgi:F420-dependent oxidoreductase-like protein
MKLGLQVTELWQIPGGPPEFGSRLAEIAQAAEGSGFYSLWAADHLLSAMSLFGRPIDDPILESQTTLAFLAGHTSKAHLGTLVTCNLFRAPALLVKTITTIDVLSGGRAYFGIGTGWFEREADALGFAFPSVKKRLDRLEETVRLAKHMWSGGSVPFAGSARELAEPINSPQPLTRPHPPILIGGGGERRTLRLIARYADACCFFIGSNGDAAPARWRELYATRVAVLGRKFEVLRRHCDEVGRPYEAIEKAVQVFWEIPNAERAPELIVLCSELADLGVTHLILNLRNVHEIAPIEWIGARVNRGAIR